ncbi:hypothetical protein HDV06_003323 [Boothiomyces sp. JEL0866]|nr:hypothetical protein HDV06_003323 [Boothiomyces sp. JEL0866]
MSIAHYLEDPEDKIFKSKSFQKLVQSYINAILSNPETRNVFFFLLLNMSFTVVEFLYGWWNNSLGLTADAIHMLFDSTAIIFSLIASVITKWDKNRSYTFGFGRVETLTGFINALALVFASGNIIWEAIERLYSPEKLNTDNLLVVSILGLLVNIVGIFAFDHGGAIGRKGHDCGHDHGHDHSHHDHSHDHHGHSHSHGQNPLMHGMFLHVLSDALGSVGVIVSCVLIQWFDWQWSDPLCSIFIAVLTVIGCWPLLKTSGEILLQRVPHSLDESIGATYYQISSIPGVLGYSKAHFWELNQGEYVGAICVQIHRNVDDQSVLYQVQQIYRQIGINNVTVQIEKDLVHSY